MKDNLKDMVQNYIDNPNDDSFEKLYRNTYKKLFYSIMHKVGNKEEAKEILQYTYMKACLNIDKLDKPENFYKWTYTIASNKCIDYFKKKKNINFSDVETEDFQIDIEDETEEFNPEKSLDKKELVSYISSELDKLPENQKVCIMMYYFENMKISEIAQVLGCSEATVKSRIKYGKDKLAKSIGEYQKKNDIKLYSVSIVPLLLFCFEEEVKAISINETLLSDLSSSVVGTATKSMTKKVVKESFFKKLFASTTNKIITLVICTMIVVPPVVNQMLNTVQESKNSFEIYESPQDLYLAAIENMKNLDNFRITVNDAFGKEYRGYLYNSDKEYNLDFVGDDLYIVCGIFKNIKDKNELFIQNAFWDNTGLLSGLGEGKMLADRVFFDIEMEEADGKVVITYINTITEYDYPRRTVKAIINKDMLIEKIIIADKITDDSLGTSVKPSSENTIIFDDYNSKNPYIPIQEYEKAIEKTKIQDFDLKFEENNNGYVDKEEMYFHNQVCDSYDTEDIFSKCKFSIERLCILDFFERGSIESKFIESNIEIKKDEKIITGVFRYEKDGYIMRDLLTKVIINQKGLLEKIEYDWYDKDYTANDAADYYMGKGSLVFDYK